MDTVETERLVLRNFRPEDAADLFAYLHAPRSACFLDMALADLDAARAEAETRARADDYVAVCLRDGGRVIGDLFRFHEPPDTYSVGWNFHEDVAGAGYASEAARALFSHLFRVEGARRLYAYVEEDNHPSRRLCERLGMRAEGLFREFISFETGEDGMPRYVDTMQYAILSREWVG
jgi:RimJ/RimL family protein N-acetyltransferase